MVYNSVLYVSFSLSGRIFKGAEHIDGDYVQPIAKILMLNAPEYASSMTSEMAGTSPFMTWFSPEDSALCYGYWDLRSLSSWNMD